MWLLEQFNENPEDKHKKALWKSVKHLKAKYNPKYIKMKDKDGKPVATHKRAEAIADYLEQKHWTNEIEKRFPRRKPNF